MSAIDTLCFDDFDPVAGGATNGPTIDGFLFHDIGMENRDKVESGYVRGCRYVWNGGSESVLEFQGVKADRFLVFGFFSRFDPSFNEADRIVIAIKPSDSAPVDQHRRIDIAPVRAFGATNADGTQRPVAGPGDTSQDSDLLPPLPERDPPEIRPNYPPRMINTWKGTRIPGDPDTRWEELPATFDASLAVKVRSWTPPSTGGASPGVGWSVEIKLPIDAVGTDWPGILTSFKLFMTVLRFTGTPTGFVHPKRQFPRDRPPLSGTFGASLDIPAISYGTGLIGAGLGSGVRFKNDWQGLGRLSGGTIGGSIIHNIDGTGANTLVARIENTSPTDPANNVVAEFRFGKYGLPPGGAAGSERWRDWRQFDNMEPVGPVYPKRTAAQNVPVGPPTVDLTRGWTLSLAERSEFAPPNQHRCMVGQLFSTQNVNFVQSSVRSNTNFVNLSEHEREAEVSGVGYVDPPDGGPDHDFVLFSFSRVIPGSHVLELDPELAGGTSIEGLTKNLLTALARPSTGNEGGDVPAEYVGQTIRISASELYWGPSDREAQTLQISAIKKSPDERLRVRIPGSKALQDEHFDWEEVDSRLSPDDSLSLQVTPRALQEDGSRSSEIPFSVYRNRAGNTWEFVEQGTIKIHKDGAASVIPDPRNPVESLKQALVILWITFGYRRTGQFLTIDGITSEVLDDEPGAFGLVALHQGANDNVGWSLSSPGLTTLAPGITSLKVPHQGATNLNVRLFAKPDGPQGDVGPRFVQVLPQRLEWAPRDSKPKSVDFTLVRPFRDGQLRLEIGQSPTSDGLDFVWKELNERLDVNKTVSLSVDPPRDDAGADRRNKIRYRILIGDGGGPKATVLEQGLIWLVKHGRTDSKPPEPDRFPFDLIAFIRRRFRSLFPFITRERQ